MKPQRRTTEARQRLGDDCGQIRRKEAKKTKRAQDVAESEKDDAAGSNLQDGSIATSDPYLALASEDRNSAMKRPKTFSEVKKRLRRSGKKKERAKDSPESENDDKAQHFDATPEAGSWLRGISWVTPLGQRSQSGAQSSSQVARTRGSSSSEEDAPHPKPIATTQARDQKQRRLRLINNFLVGYHQIWHLYKEGALDTPAFEFLRSKYMAPMRSLRPAVPNNKGGANEDDTGGEATEEEEEEEEVEEEQADDEAIALQEGEEEEEEAEEEVEA